jgi:hypothetical protein
LRFRTHNPVGQCIGLIEEGGNGGEYEHKEEEEERIEEEK